jgi:hypothetical protein
MKFSFDFPEPSVEIDGLRVGFLVPFAVVETGSFVMGNKFSVALGSRTSASGGF